MTKQADFEHLLKEIEVHRKRERDLERVILEAIDVLAETKNSFKSRRLGELRERLHSVLVGER
jgi:hypothetical protein